MDTALGVHAVAPIKHLVVVKPKACLGTRGSKSARRRCSCIQSCTTLFKGCQFTLSIGASRRALVHRPSNIHPLRDSVILLEVTAWAIHRRPDSLCHADQVRMSGQHDAGLPRACVTNRWRKHIINARKFAQCDIKPAGEGKIQLTDDTPGPQLQIGQCQLRSPGTWLTAWLLSSRI